MHLLYNLFVFFWSIAKNYAFFRTIGPDVLTMYSSMIRLAMISEMNVTDRGLGHAKHNIIIIIICYDLFNLQELFTALHLASAMDHLNIVKFLVERCGADIDAKSIDSSTPLTMACTAGNLRIVEYLVGKEADIENLRVRL